MKTTSFTTSSMVSSPFARGVTVAAAMIFCACSIGRPLHAQDDGGSGEDGEETGPKITRPLDVLIDSDATWEMDQDAFEKAFGKLGFDWNSSHRGIARFAGGGLGLWGEPVGETLVDFSQGKVFRIAVSIYNRGDNRDIVSESVFDELIEDWKTRVAERTGTEPVDRGKNSSSAVRAEGFLFQDKSVTRLLEFSSQRRVISRGIPFRGEFVKLRFARTPKDDFFREHLGDDDGRRKTKDDLVEYVRRKENGDVVIEPVPMVDQGGKGYCVVASTERVMRYYGVAVDQHEMAQVAGADAARGTSTDAMVGALKKLTGRLKLRVRSHLEMTWDDFKDMADDYNRYARKAGQDDVEPERYMAYVYELFDGEVLKEARTGSRSQFGRFERDVVEHIDEGIPLLWTVWLGYFPEEGIPQPPNSGHMRLIIGYNKETREILYSDSWGQGHELKRMPLDRAFTCSTGLYTIEPLK